MPRESKTSANRLRAREKKLRALELRKGGATFEQIGNDVGVSTSAAYKYVMEALRDTLREPAEELRTIELERIDRLLLALWPDAARGNVQKVDRVLRIMERRAALLGLDAPKKLEQSGTQGGPLTVVFTQREDGPQ